MARVVFKMAKKELTLWADSIQADIERILQENEKRKKQQEINENNRAAYSALTNPKPVKGVLSRPKI